VSVQQRLLAPAMVLAFAAACSPSAHRKPVATPTAASSKLCVGERPTAPPARGSAIAFLSDRTGGLDLWLSMSTVQTRCPDSDGHNRQNAGVVSGRIPHRLPGVEDGVGAAVRDGR
jgi:hypothetical protein